ncbi:MAG: thioredoxin family protein [Bacteroidales bacterium]|nr:thioredoxin family protein [Bacteroidales bacterium]
MRLGRLLTIVFVLFAAVRPSAQVVTPVKWGCKVTASGDVATIQFTATVEPGWHLYSQYNTLGITQQTVFEFEKSANYALIGKTTEPKYVELTDEFGTDRYFDKSPVVFTQKIKVKSEKDFILNASVDAQACMEGKCVMVGEEFEIPVKGVPQAAQEDVSETDENVTDSTAEVSSVAEDDKGEQEAVITADEETDAKKSMSLWAVFFIAIAAGFAALLTPCVFPLIPMTINFFMHGAGEENKQSGIRQAWMFGGSIIFIFAILGAILTLLFGPDAMYNISTHWIPNLIFFVIFLIFALSFFGLFEITLPSWMINKSDAKADQGGFMAPFFIALTTVLVSFSCTGPILGGALVGLSTSGGANRMIPLLSMLGFGIGFATPFTLLAMFPKFLSKLKSGSWLNTVKVVFAFLELAFGLKFLSMADLYCGWHILDREVYLALWIVIFALMGFYLLGKLRFNGDSEVKEISVLRLFLAILTFSFTIYMVPGMFGAPLNAISGFIPPMSTQDFDIKGMMMEQHKQTVAQLQAQHVDVQASSSLPADRKYVDELETVPGFEAFFDLDEAKAYARKVNKPIFIDFTGKTCANCRKMEQYVWSDPQVTPLLQQEFVMCALYSDANIRLPESEWVKDDRGRPLKTLGRKNVHFQQSNFNVNAQPYYVLMDADGKVLTRKNHQYDRNVQHFIEFLNEGLANFKKGASER